jgi:hypothetical protein
MSQHPDKKNSWEHRTRAERKRCVIRIKNQIRSNTSQLGGLFTTHDVIDGNSWADIYFLSTHHRMRIYNATIDTGLYAYAARCEDIAWKNSEKLLPPEEDEPESFKDLFVKEPGGNLYTLSEDKPSKIERERRALGGLRLYEWIDREKERLADAGDVFVSPSVRLDHSYRFGVGLMATLPAEFLSIQNLDQFVAEFRERGEKEYRIDSIKLSYPSTRLKEASSVNAISLDPKEWASSMEPTGAAQIAMAREEREALSSAIADSTATAQANAPRKPTTL